MLASLVYSPFLDICSGRRAQLLGALLDGRVWVRGRLRELGEDCEVDEFIYKDMSLKQTAMRFARFLNETDHDFGYWSIDGYVRPGQGEGYGLLEEDYDTIRSTFH